MTWTHIASSTFSGGIGAINSTGANILVAAIRYYGSDSGFQNNVTAAANVWTLIGSSGGTIGPKTDFYVCDNPAYVGADTGVGGGNAYFTTSIAAFVRPAGTLSISAIVDEEAAGVSSLAPGSITPAANDALVLAGFAFGGTVGAPTIPSGFASAGVLSGDAGSRYGGGLAYLNQATAAAVNPSWSTPAAADSTAAALAFTVAGAPAVPVLSSPTVVSTGNGIATVRVTTDTAPSGSSTLAVRTRAAAAPAWTAAEVLASPTATLTSGASGARDFNLTGLVNGTALAADFAQTGPSNLVSTASFTPSTVPGAPTIGTAVAGNAQATVNGTAPGSTGGSAITGYRSTATPGGSTVTGASLPITHTGLTNGTAYTFTLAAQNANGFSAESAASNSVTPTSGAIPVAFTGTVGAQSGTVGSAYSWSGAALSSFFSGSLTPFAYSISAGSLPPGLTLNTSTGVVSGTPTTAGSYAATFRATDTSSNTASSNSVAFTVAAAPPPPPGSITLPAVATDATGSTRRTGQTTRMVLEPFTTIEALGTGTRTIVTGTTDPTTGEVTIPGGTVAAGTYAVIGLFPSTGSAAALQGVRFRVITVA